MKINKFFFDIKKSFKGENNIMFFITFLIKNEFDYTTLDFSYVLNARHKVFMRLEIY